MSLAPNLSRVEVLTRPGCHLCEEAIEIVNEVCGRLGESWSETNIDEDPDLQGKYTDQVPVFFVDGRQVGYWRMTPDELVLALTNTSDSAM